MRRTALQEKKARAPQEQAYEPGIRKSSQLQDIRSVDFLEFKHDMFTSGGLVKKRQMECIGDCQVADKPTSIFCVRKENAIWTKFLEDWQQKLPHKLGWKIFQKKTPVADCTEKVCGRWTCHFQQHTQGSIIDKLVIRCEEPSAADLSAAFLNSPQTNAEGDGSNKKLCRRTTCRCRKRARIKEN